MNIEESIEVLKNMILMPDGWIIGKDYKGNLEFIGCLEGQEAIETLLTAYEEEKEKNKELSNSYDKLAKECNEENRRCMLLAVENQDLKEKNKKIEKELEKHIEFCEQEAEGSLNNEICHISLRFNKRLLDIIKEE